MATQESLLHERIIQDPQIMVGKPVVKGTRIPVERVVGLLAQNPDPANLFAAYPELTIDDVKACLQYAHALVEGRRPRLRRSLASIPSA